MRRRITRVSTDGCLAKERRVRRSWGSNESPVASLDIPVIRRNRRDVFGSIFVGRSSRTPVRPNGLCLDPTHGFRRSTRMSVSRRSEGCEGIGRRERACARSHGIPIRRIFPVRPISADQRSSAVNNPAIFSVSPCLDGSTSPGHIPTDREQPRFLRQTFAPSASFA
jgi:hypothetical protein